MIKIELTEQEWNQLLSCATLAPYAQVAPLLQKVVAQLQNAKSDEALAPSLRSGNGAEKNVDVR